MLLITSGRFIGTACNRAAIGEFVDDTEVDQEANAMTCRVLIVEDEIFVASEIEQIVAEMGHDPVAIAADKKSALRFASNADVALVDLNLRDGPTGIEIGRILAQTHGVGVIFITANPAQLGEGVPGTIGVVSKPVAERDLRDVVDYAAARRAAADAAPPRRLKLFAWPENGTLAT